VAEQVLEHPYQALSRDEALETLGTSDRGLANEEAQARLERFGPNEIREVRGRPLWLKFVENFTHVFALLFWFAAILSFISGSPQAGWAIIAVIVINAIFSFIQEFKAEKATEALKRLIPSRAKVLRDGETREIMAVEIVPGDILVLEEGDNISADARLIEEFEIRTNNSTLNGESEPSRKTSSSLSGENMNVIDIPNFVFAGTSVAYGNGKAVVFATGMKTQFGKIAELTQSVKEELSPLQRQIQSVVRLVATLAIVMGIVFFLLGRYLAHLTLVDGLIFAIGIIVANMPEGLPPTVTLSLSLGVQRMAKRNALIKKLSSVETLGSTTVICTDKTGTLTKNEMTVRSAWVDERMLEVTGTGYEPTGGFELDGRDVPDAETPAVQLLARIAGLANNARLIPPSASEPNWKVIGDPTEAALLVAARKAGLDLEAEFRTHKRVFELPFDSVRKRMATIHAAKGGRVAYVKGAPKEVLELSTHLFTSEGVRPIDDVDRDVIVAQNDGFARSGLRVLAMAYRDLPAESREYTAAEVERDLVFVGLMAMMDPPREEVSQAVLECYTAGIKIIMITGDYGLTAESIARRIGIVCTEQTRIITGVELNDMSDDDLKEALKEGCEVLFARVAPEHKMRIARTLKSMGHVVAMTGDGVNDAPALKTADIGVAMGIAGTDVAKEAADMILTDDNFASIVGAIEEGRAVFDNIRRFITHIFTHLTSEAIPYILFVIAGIPLPILVMQILAIDLGTDLLPAIALGSERPEPGIMEQAPRPRKERLVNFNVIALAYLFLGPFETLFGSMGAYFFVYFTHGWRPWMGVHALAASGPVYVEATTMCMAGIIAMQIGSSYARRTNRRSVFEVGLFSNTLLNYSVLLAVGLLVLLAYVPPVAAVFTTGPLSAIDWVYLVAVAPVLLIVEEIRKWFIRRGAARGTAREVS
jgi:P-type Ca2+ transporter type 2C